MASAYDEAETRIKLAYERRCHDLRAGLLETYAGAGNLFIYQSRERRVLELLHRNFGPDLRSLRILDVGCGTGCWLREFIKWGVFPKNLAGVDLLEDSVAEARERCPVGVRIDCGSAARLSFEDGAFDLVMQAVVFTSILDGSLKRQVAREILRVLRPGGALLWYDFTINNPRNPDVAGVKKNEIRALFPNCRVDLECTTLAPPLARALAPYSWLACYLLEKAPFLCTHYLGLIHKP